MTRSTLKLAPIRDESSRAKCLKRRRPGLVKKVRELSTLCDLKACVIIFSPDEVEPMVWPSVEETRELLHHFFALPVYERKRKETTQEAYLRENNRKLGEHLMKMQKKERDFVVDQLMLQLQGGGELVDLNSSEIDDLQYFAREKIQRLRKRLGLIVEHPPPPPPPSQPLIMHPGVPRICIGNLRENNQSQYLMDTWVFNSYVTSDPNFYQQVRMEMAFHNMNLGSYLPYHDDNKAMVMNQPRSNNNNGDLEFHMSINTIATTHGLHQEPPPNHNGTNHRG